MTTYYLAERRADGFVSLTQDPHHADRASAARQLRLHIAEGTMRADTAFTVEVEPGEDPYKKAEQRAGLAGGTSS